MSNKGKIRVYSVGGAGMNLGSLLEKHRNQTEVAFGEIEINYIDTSKSNLRSNIDQSHCYLIDGLDGSGKIRSENHEEINDRIRAILQQFKPADLNIILGSAAGGSGSVIGPLLTRELLAQEVPVIVLNVGSADTRIDAENTLKTIKSYESVARLSNAPVVMYYVQNSQTTPRLEADNLMFNMVLSLAVLFSRENREMDSRDLFNWLRFNRVTTFPVQLASVSLVEDKESMSEIGNIISVATLAREGMNTALSEKPEYQCVGFLPENADDPVLSKAPLHFVISDGIFNSVHSHLTSILKELEEKQQARLKHTNLLNDKDKPHDNGLVL
jgi:cell division GTPase FtsZ